MDSLGNILLLMYSIAYNLWTFTWFVHFELPFGLKGTEKIHTERFFKFPSNIYSIRSEKVFSFLRINHTYWIYFIEKYHFIWFHFHFLFDKWEFKKSHGNYMLFKFILYMHPFLTLFIFPLWRHVKCEC